ncbi:cystatin-like protein [Drosophila subobscura]|uniref:cystatin-like protein n=1 Tax=Drosophila subobscura TaxID=7241 RepID=UPI00155A1E9E|nr:cystatin-like protein [Drosophila subobscura]
MNCIQFFCLLCLMVVSCADVPRGAGDGRYLPGAPRLLIGESRRMAIRVLDESLAKLTTGPNYKAVNVTQVTSQNFNEFICTYKVELEVGSEKKECTVHIVFQPWPDVNDNINIQCEGDNVIDELIR